MCQNYVNLFFRFVLPVLFLFFFWLWSGWQQSIKAIVFPHHISQWRLLLGNELCPSVLTSCQCGEKNTGSSIDRKTASGLEPAALFWEYKKRTSPDLRCRYYAVILPDPFGFLTANIDEYVQTPFFYSRGFEEQMCFVCFLLF